MTKNEMKKAITHDVKEGLFDIINFHMSKYREYLSPLEIANMVADAASEISFIVAIDTIEDRKENL